MEAWQLFAIVLGAVLAVCFVAIWLRDRRAGASGRRQGPSA